VCVFVCAYNIVHGVPLKHNTRAQRHV